MSHLLIIDDDPIVRAALKRTLQNQGYEVTVASNGEEGIIQAQQIKPALIICDWVMQPVDGLEVCRQIKDNSELSATFFILLTAKGKGSDKESVDERVKGLDAGADEFVSKPIDMEEVKARVRAGLRLYELNQTLQLQKHALEALNQELRADLDEAAEYVSSLLPAPLAGKITTEAKFIPSAQLGGDCFDYYWLDSDHLAMYLLDVSGHGVGSALLSVSVLNVLRTQSLPNTDFCRPSEVLSALNNGFQMSAQGDKYFTIWYGVYNTVNRQLVYANAGHPPAILLSGASETAIQVQRLESTGMPIGFIPDADFDEAFCEIPPSSTMYIFSDGAYEILLTDTQIWGLESFISFLIDSQQKTNFCLDKLIDYILCLNSKKVLDDDLSLLRVNFN